ncbi:MAG: hypothetical protein V3T35_05975, partial [Spirochaetia bacterium]
MKAKVLLFSLLLATSLLFSLSAYDWGGTIDNSTSLAYTFKDPDPYLFQKDKIALWLVSEFTPSLKFSIQGSFTYTFEQPRPDFPSLP